MRVTSLGVSQSLSRALSSAAERMAKTNEQLATGQKYSHASDNPVDVGQVLRLDSELAAADAYGRSATDARAWLTTLDQSLTDISRVLAEADTLLLSGVNSSMGADQRQAIGRQILALRDQVMSAANSSYLGQAVMAGHSQSAVSYNAATDTYSFTGVVGEVRRQVDPAVVIDVSVDGSALLGFSGAPGSDVFSTLTNAVNAVMVGNATQTMSVRATLQSHTENVLAAVETTGTRFNNLERVTDRMTLITQETQRERAAVGEVDISRAYLEVTAAQTAYQAALAAVAKSSMPSLADFI